MEATIANKTASPCFELKGSLFTLTILQLLNLDTKRFVTELGATIEKAPNFFQHAPIVIDLQKLPANGYKIDFHQMVQLLRDKNLVPVGVCGGDETLQQAAIEAGLAIFPVNKNVSENKADKKEDNNSAGKKATSTKIISQPVRSGQQIYAKDSDLIVLSSVSNGAEILADGNIHVYGQLHGRALAGASGDKQARIFCKHFNAELVSIAGLYQLSEDFEQEKSDNFMQIYLENDRLCLTEL